MVVCDDGFLDWQIVKILNAIFDETTLEIDHQYCLVKEDFDENEEPLADGMIVYLVKNMRKIPRTEKQWTKMTKTCLAVYYSKDKKWHRVK